MEAEFGTQRCGGLRGDPLGEVVVELSGAGGFAGCGQAGYEDELEREGRGWLVMRWR